MKWVAVLKTGMYSDTYLFLVGTYDTKEEAEQSVEQRLDEMASLWDRFSSGDDDYSVDSLCAQEEHEKMFNMDHYFPPRDPNEWKATIAHVDENTCLRLF